MKKRYAFLYILVAILPLIIMDAAAIGAIVRSENRDRIHEMETTANSIHYTLVDAVSDADKLSQGVYTSKYVYDFINREFDSGLDYYNAYREFFNDTLIDLVDGQTNNTYKMYLDNDTIVNGAQFHKLSDAEDKGWFEYIKASGLKRGLIFYYDTGRPGAESGARTIYFFQTLDFYDHGSNNLLLVDMNYANVNRLLQNSSYDMDFYICDEWRVLFSNSKDAGIGKEYESVAALDDIGYKKDIQLYNQDLTICIKAKDTTRKKLFSVWGGQLLLLGLINILIPVFVISRISRFFYTYRLKEQEMIVTRQHAELLALHSQINPHFLFNALESIRMHSVIKQETETAEMVERLAKLQRQYTEWNEDNVHIEKEAEFAENYLGLQKYRFGDRLSYSIEIDDDCKDYTIPKLTLVTFVENACVHGIENKNKNGWIFVRVYRKDDILNVEIEDTGCGMSKEETEELLERMRNADMEHLQRNKNVGIVNACLRLKMLTKNTVKFDLESEEGVGTIVSFTVPVDILGA